MNKKIVQFTLIISTFLFSLNAFSACNANACSSVYIDTLYVTSGDTIYVGTSGDERLLNCGAVSDVYLTIKLSTYGGNAMYAALLTAQSLGKKAKIRTSTAAGCPVSYIVVNK